MRAFFVVAIFMVCYPSQATETDKRKISQFLDHVFPHIAFGGSEWKTTFFFLNPTDETEIFPVKFYSDDGKPMKIPCLGGMYDQVAVTLPPMASYSFETEYRAEVPWSWGWAVMDPQSGDVQGLAILRQRVPGRNDVEATVPTDSQYENTKRLLFDNTGGFVMGVAVANPSSWEIMKVQVRFYDQNGSMFYTESFYMDPMTHTAFVLPDKFQQSGNKKGTVVFTSEETLSGPAILGLRFSPNGSFTSVHPFGDF